MSIGQFLIHWMVRSAILTIAGAILLRNFRVRDASFRMASWTAILCASAAMPILSGILPDVPLVVPRSELVFAGKTKVPVSPVRSAAGSLPGRPAPMEYSGAARHTGARPGPIQSLVKGLKVTRLNWGFDWSAAALALYIVVCAVLLLRIGVGLVIGERLRRRSMPTALNDVCESNAVNAPVTLGIVRPAIVLPMDWRGWDRARLEAVLAHERSHLRRWDPVALLFSAIHRALLWASPLSWFLHAKLVQTAEEVSDDAAVAVCDRVHYTEILLDFMNRKAPGLIRTGLPMARHGDPEKRLLRILDEPAISSDITKRAAATIIGVSLPITCLIAATKAEFAPRLDTVQGQPALEARYVARYMSGPSVLDSGERMALKETRLPSPVSAVPVLAAPVLAQVGAQAPGPVNVAPVPAEVRLTLSVADPAGRWVDGLTAQDFRVTRGEISADISSFGLTAGEHSVVLLNTIAGGEEVVNALRSVLDSRDELAVRAGPPAADAAMLLDAVVAAVNQVKGMTNPYKSVVVIMQGGSPYPMAGEPDLARIVRAALRSLRVNVFFANIEDITKPSLGVFSQQDDLRILAGLTGGQVVTAPSAGEIATSLKRLGVGLAHQYVIGFIPGNAPVGALGRPPRVEVAPRGGYPPLHVIGPGGYYVEP